MEELLRGFAILLTYFIVAASVAFTARYFIKIPKEIFRKSLHFILLGSLFVFVFGFKTWWLSALAAIIFEIVVFPILAVFERYRKYSEVTTERKKGELKISLLLVFTMFAIVISICWGWIGDKYLVLASILAWGVGDAFAALIGVKYGKNKIEWKFIDGKKSYQGTLTMFLTSLISVAIVLMFRGGLNIAGYIIIPIVTAAVSALTELFSKNGLDTVICPLSAMVVISFLVYLFEGVL